MAYSDLVSIDKMLINAEAGGILQRAIALVGAASTTANTTSGYITGYRYPVQFTVPSLTGYSGWLMNAHAFTEDGGHHILVALEYDLGALTVSGNSFSAGTDASMPSKTTNINGTSYTEQTASMMTFVVATTALTATTPTLTITYVNEDGTGSRTATLTLPSSPTVNSAFDMTPHLQSGDTGVQDITNMSISAGSAGVLRVKGLLPLIIMHNPASALFTQISHLQKGLPLILAESGEKIGFYKLSAANAASELTLYLTGVPI